MKPPKFYFYAYKHKVSGPETNNDHSINFRVGEDDTKDLSPFILVKPNSRLKITVEVVE